MTPRELFKGNAQARRLYEAVHDAVARIGPYTTRVSKSQIAFRRRKSFAAVWMPGQYLHGDVAPMVLTVFLPQRIRSRRWKEVVEPVPGRFTHHLEVHDVADIDEEVRAWLRLAWEAA